MDKQEIMKILPHRDAMLLIDEAEVVDGRAHARRTITGDEFFLKGHFPDDPIVPGVILCEILAQSACVLLSDKAAGDIRTLFTGLDKVKFKNPVRPGDTLETTCEITAQKGPFYFATGEGRVDGKLCVRADFSFAVLPKDET